MRIIAVLLVILLSTVMPMAMAQIYKIVGPDGRVTYTDTPPEGMQIEPMVLPELFTEPGMELPDPATEDTEPMETPTDPLSISVLTPLPETTIPPGQITVPVQIQLSRPLLQDQLVRVLLNGELKATSPNTEFVLDELERGTHQLQAQVINASGQIEAVSDPVTIYVQRASIQNTPIPPPQ